jgi:hypothetical protein
MSLDRARDLETALAPYAHAAGLVEHIRGSCGADPSSSLDGQVAVRGYSIVVSETVFSVYVLTADGFVVAEMGSDGTTLAVFVEHFRIARVAELCTADTRTVIVEIDGDNRRVVLNGEERGGTNGAGEEYLAIHAITGSIIPASYEIRAGRDDAELIWLARQLRRPNG